MACESHLGFRFLFLSICVLCLFRTKNAVILPFPTSIGDEFKFDLQITIPYTVALPKFVGQLGRRKRSFQSSVNHKNISALTTSEDTRFTQLQSVFSKIGIEDFACQKRLLCKVCHNFESFSPLSDFILQYVFDLRSGRKIHINETSESDLRLKEFYEIGRKGLNSNTDCDLETSACPFDLDKVEMTLCKHSIVIENACE